LEYRQKATPVFFGGVVVADDDEVEGKAAR
jgi:hypothetical protein